VMINFENVMQRMRESGDPLCEKCPWKEAPPKEKASFFTMIREDIQTVFAKDPAARSLPEVLSCYPGLHAIWFHRLAHFLWRRGFLLLARLISHLHHERLPDPIAEALDKLCDRIEDLETRLRRVEGDGHLSVESLESAAVEG